jgi:hypothetical protein
MDQRVENLINNVADYAGATTALVLQNFLDPTSAALTAVSITTIAKMGISDFAVRDLSKREQIKVGLAAAKAIEKIQYYLDKHYAPRLEEFKPVYGNKRSRAEEILEGILLKSKNEHEEKKLNLIASIFPNFAFLGEISFQQANLSLGLASSMSYTSMCILEIIYRKYEETDRGIMNHDFSDNLSDNPHTKTLSVDVSFLLLEINGLLGDGLINQAGLNGDGFEGWVDTNYKGSYSATLDDLSIINPSALILSEMGERFRQILSLEDVPDQDLSSVFYLLSEPKK